MEIIMDDGSKCKICGNDICDGITYNVKNMLLLPITKHVDIVCSSDENLIVKDGKLHYRVEYALNKYAYCDIEVIEDK